MRLFRVDYARSKARENRRTPNASRYWKRLSLRAKRLECAGFPALCLRRPHVAPNAGLTLEERSIERPGIAGA
jgi:hypothetical protein